MNPLNDYTNLAERLLPRQAARHAGYVRRGASALFEHDIEPTAAARGVELIRVAGRPHVEPEPPKGWLAAIVNILGFGV
jgi:hypothetical protein